MATKRKTKVGTNWLGKRKASEFDVCMQRCLKISPADEILAPEVDRLKSFYSWIDETHDKLISKTDDLQELVSCTEKMAEIFMDVYGFESNKLTESMENYQSICINSITVVINEYKERLADEIIIIENYQRNALMALVSLVEDRQQKKKDYFHYKGKFDKLNQAMLKKRAKGPIPEKEEEKFQRNQEKLDSSRVAWEEVKDTVVNSLQCTYEDRFTNLLDILIIEHARNEITYTQEICALLETVYGEISDGNRQRQVSSVMGEKDEETPQVYKTATGMFGRTVKSKFMTETGGISGENEYDALLYRLDYLYLTCDDFLEAVTNFNNVMKAITNTNKEFAIEFEATYKDNFTDLRDVVNFYSGTWKRFEPIFSQKFETAINSNSTDFPNFQSTLVQQFSASAKTYLEQKKQYEHYQAKVKKIESSKKQSKLESNRQKLQQSETAYLQTKATIIGNMRSVFEARYTFFDPKTMEHINNEYRFYQSLTTSICPMLTRLPEKATPGNEEEVIPGAPTPAGEPGAVPEAVPGAAVPGAVPGAATPPPQPGASNEVPPPNMSVEEEPGLPPPLPPGAGPPPAPGTKAAAVQVPPNPPETTNNIFVETPQNESDSESESPAAPTFTPTAPAGVLGAAPPVKSMRRPLPAIPKAKSSGLIGLGNEESPLQKFRNERARSSFRAPVGPPPKLPTKLPPKKKRIPVSSTAPLPPAPPSASVSTPPPGPGTTSSALDLLFSNLQSAHQSYKQCFLTAGITTEAQLKALTRPQISDLGVNKKIHALKISNSIAKLDFSQAPSVSTISSGSRQPGLSSKPPPAPSGPPPATPPKPVSLPPKQLSGGPPVPPPPPKQSGFSVLGNELSSPPIVSVPPPLVESMAQPSPRLPNKLPPKPPVSPTENITTTTTLTEDKKPEPVETKEEATQFTNAELGLSDDEEDDIWLY